MASEECFASASTTAPPDKSLFRRQHIEAAATWARAADELLELKTRQRYGLAAHLGELAALDKLAADATTEEQLAWDELKRVSGRF